MEESLMIILDININQIKSLCQRATELGKLIRPVTPTRELRLEAEINVSKLDRSLAKLKNDLNNYFRLATEPAVDDISRVTTIQLEAEEQLCELQVLLKQTKDTDTTPKDGALQLTGKLPKLTLPEFSGDLLQWNQFWDQFQSLVHNRNINNVDKLLYLSSALRGEAKTLISGLAMTNENYQIATDLLKSRYGRIDLVKDAHYSALSKIKPAENSTSACRKTLNEIERHLRVLNALGEDITQNHLRFLILEKFPEEIIYELKKSAKGYSVAEIRSTLEELISAKEDASRLTQGNDLNTGEYTTETLHIAERTQNFNTSKWDNQHTFHRTRGSTYHHNNGSKRRFPTDNKNQNRWSNSSTSKVSRNWCAFCNGNHVSEDCQRYTTLTNRRAKLGGNCYGCLNRGHRIRFCRKKITCRHCNTSGHHPALCAKKYTVDKRDLTVDTTKGEDQRNTDNSNSTIQCHVNDTGLTVLQTAIVNIVPEDKQHNHYKCRSILDSGSMRTYITRRLANLLQLKPIEESRLTIFTFGSHVPQEIDSPRVRFLVTTKSNKAISIEANVVPTITQSVPYFRPDQQLLKSNLDLADDGSLGDGVDLLLGNDYYYTLMLPEKKKLQENLHLVNSELGWIVSGKAESGPMNELEVITYFQTSLEVKLNQPDLPLSEVNLKDLWDLEAIGIVDSPKETREENAIHHFNETTEFKENRYQVSWPWIDYPPEIHPNLGLAVGRLMSLVKRLDEETLSSYNQLLKDQVEKGIVEIVPEDEIDRPSQPVHYLPHHCVHQAGKPIRIVYDASSKVRDSKSLNQCLYCGPLMLEDLTGLILKFRSHNIGICADVEKAFLQIGLHTKDRDVTRFLWIKNLNEPVHRDNLVHMRFCRVPFGVISSPFLLNATIKYHLERSDSKVTRDLARDIYVDNLVTGTDTVEEAVNLYTKSKQCFEQMSMNLRDWGSNSQEFLKKVPDTCPDNKIKVLGLLWNLTTDTLHLRVKEREYANTKRGVLQCIASVYDPCGYAAASMLPAKLFLQELWIKKIKWDTTLSDEQITKWQEIKEQLKSLHHLEVPRCYVKDSLNKEISIHCFTDASTKAYAAVVYVVQGNTRTFVIGKSRLVPIKDCKDLKIPRLELLGVLIGHRLIQYVKKFIQCTIKQEILWTDSQIVISWHNSDKLLTPFVSKRIQEIKGNKNLIVRYIPTDLNPADVATRPDWTRETTNTWLTGPDFLSHEPPEWPKHKPVENVLLTGEGQMNNSMDVDKIDDIETRPTNNTSEGNETWQRIKKIQSEHFTEELAGRETSLKRNLNLFKDENGIIRSKGRFENAAWSYDQRYPILLPRDSSYTDEIIMRTHKDNCHVGATHTLSLIRKSFWIPQGKSKVSRVIKNCVQCVKHGGGPFKLPPTPALPPERVNYSEPYTYTGIDYLGPIVVRTKTGSEKRWICLFTCLAVRAVHLEVVGDLTAEEGLLALRRFVATRNLPTLITSDNASNFKLISEVLTQPYCIDKSIKWRFIPQLAPWFGGFYERLVGMVKNCMVRTLEKHLLTDNQLNTIVKEIEAVLNSRPLTYVDEEPIHILRPSDFIAMGRTIAINTTIEENPPEGTRAKNDLINSWKRGIRIIEEFKEMFTNRYLLSLRERYSHNHKQSKGTSTLEPKEGQVVQIKGDSKNRESWKVGKLVTLVKGADHMCRVAKVQVGDKIYTRSIAQLYPLEVEDTTYNDVTPSPIEQMNVTRDFNDSINDPINEDINIDVDVSETLVEGNGEQELMDDTESIFEEPSPTGERLINDSDIIKETTEDTIGASPITRQRRAAAVQARERIRHWTRSLVALLAAGGCVANV